MRYIAFRVLAYSIAGFSVGFAAWAVICDAPLESSEANRVIAAVALIPSVAVTAYLLWMANIATGAGSRVGAAWSIVASDLVCALAGAVAAFFIIDGFSERLGGPPASLADPLAADVIAFLFLPAALVLALYLTQTGNQRIRADAEGLHVRGLSGEMHAAWTDIASFRPDEQYVLVGRLGLLFPRHLRTNLVVVLRDGETFTVFDPGTRAARRAALQSLSGSMPEAMRPKLNDIEDHWGQRS